MRLYPSAAGMACALCVLSALACCSGRAGDANRKGSGSAPPGPQTISLFALAEVRGQIEPCGCTTDPLGDLARTARLVAEARARGPALVVDAGSLLYPRDHV